jgi:hypothetical protein
MFRKQDVTGSVNFVLCQLIGSLKGSRLYRSFVESGKINNPSKQKHDGSLPWLAWRGHINKKLRCYASFRGPDI